MPINKFSQLLSEKLLAIGDENLYVDIGTRGSYWPVLLPLLPFTSMIIAKAVFVVRLSGCLSLAEKRIKHHLYLLFQVLLLLNVGVMFDPWGTCANPLGFARGTKERFTAYQAYQTYVTECVRECVYRTKVVLFVRELYTSLYNKKST